MSDKVRGADNQQGSRFKLRFKIDPSETTRQTPLSRKTVLVYLQGALHDASLNKNTRIRFAQKDRQWLLVLKRFLRQLHCNSWIYKEGKTRSVYVLETLCKDLDFHFNPTALDTKQEKIMYLKGFFDAEGGVPHNNKRFYIQLSQKNKEKILAIKLLLKDMGIESGKVHNPSVRVDPNYWRIFIATKHHQKFAKLIGSYHSQKNRIFRERMEI